MQANTESVLYDINRVLQIAELVDEATSDSSDEDSGSEDLMHPICTNFIGAIDAMNEIKFKYHMGIKRSTADFIIDIFSQSSSALSCSYVGRSEISSKCCIYIYMWYISSTVTFGQLGNLFGVTKSLAWQVVQRVSSWLITISHEYIQWPQDKELIRICRKFYEKQQIPNVIGAIDCARIVIKAPNIGKKDYYDRKKNYSLVLQAVVDADNKFLDIYCGEPGSMRDSFVLRKSSLYTRAEQDYEEMFPNSTFLLGDSAYFSTKWLVPPYKDNGHLTELQKSFNQLHLDTRVVVENTFRLLKARFRRLLMFTEHSDLNAVTNLICSICVMHNICIIKGDISNEENVEKVYLKYGFEIVNFGSSHLNRRDELFNYIYQNN